MLTILRSWLYQGNDQAIVDLKVYDMAARNRMAAEAQNFADWLALENSREINK